MADAATMRLAPPISKDAALAWLRMQASVTWGEERLPTLESTLQGIAEAMAAISSARVSHRLEPLFP
jgi:hypothetical protein